MNSDSDRDSDDTRQQSLYWNEMTQLKAHIFYLSYHCRQADRIDFWTKCIIAIASSSSIAGWVIWHSFAFLWGAIIAASQVINATKQYLPYEARRKATSEACRDLEGLFIRAESDWYYVAEGLLTDEDIHKKRIALKKDKNDTLKRSMSSVVLPSNDAYESRAAADTGRYFETVYFEGEDDD